MNELDNCIKYFEEEFKLQSTEYDRNAQDRRFIFNITILIFSSMIAFISTLGQGKPLFIGFLISFITILLLTIHYAYYDSRNYNEYIKKKIKLEFIIRLLLSFKILKIEDIKLDQLIKRIKNDFTDQRIFFVKNRKDYFNYENQRLQEYLNILSNIYENNLKSQ